MARWRERARLESGLKLDLNKLIRDGFAKQGERRRRVISWTYINTGETVASGSIETELRAHGNGWLTINLGGLDQSIRLRGVPRHFGGVQSYFACPQLGRNVSVLWMPPGAKRFLSRQAWGRQVAYGSQFETWHDRTLSLAQDIRYRLGGKDFISIAGAMPPKPKGMHWRTYEALVKRCKAHEIKCNLYFWQFGSRLRSRLKSK
jgi:hypothetical protein